MGEARLRDGCSNPGFSHGNIPKGKLGVGAEIESFGRPVRFKGKKSIQEHNKKRLLVQDQTDKLN